MIYQIVQGTNSFSVYHCIPDETEHSPSPLAILFLKLLDGSQNIYEDLEFQKPKFLKCIYIKSSQCQLGKIKDCVTNHHN